jgi:hypothetical protein
MLTVQSSFGYLGYLQKLLERSLESEKGEWSNTVAAPTTPAMTSGKKGWGRSPLPFVFSLHPLHLTCITLRRVALASHHRSLLELLRLAQVKVEEELDQSTGERWALDVEEGAAGDASSGPGSEVGAPHRTDTDPAPSLVHLR